MIDSTLVNLGCDNPEELFEQFYTSGTDMLLNLRNFVTSPNQKKTARTWSFHEASRLVGIPEHAFRKLVASHSDLPGIITELTRADRKIHKFTLDAINRLRDYAGTKYKRPDASSSLVIAVSNLKGGVGKTQTTVDLAKKIAIEGMKVLLLDFDAQGTATLISSGFIPDLELDYSDTITEILISEPNELRRVIRKTHFTGLDIVPANLAIQDVDLQLPNNEKNNYQSLGSPYIRLSTALENIKKDYDVVLIDCGPNLGMLTLNAILACDGLIIPIPPSMSDYSSFIMYAATLRNLFMNLPAKKLNYLRILISKHAGSNDALQMEAVMREQFGKYVLVNHMCETVEVPKAANEVGTVYDISKPRGSKEAHRRALQHLDDVNLEIINQFKAIWLKQASLSKAKQKEAING